MQPDGLNKVHSQIIKYMVGYPQGMEGKDDLKLFKYNDSILSFFHLNILFNDLTKKERSLNSIEEYRHFKFCTVVSKVSSFVSNPVYY